MASMRFGTLQLCDEHACKSATKTSTEVAHFYAATWTHFTLRLTHLEGVDAKIIEGHSARTIIDYADTNKVDCIVIGSHRPDLRDYFLGSTASRVVRHAKCAVHVYRSDD